MPFTYDMNLETATEGQGDWDSALNANFSILERGLTFRAMAGTTINTGQIVWQTGSGTLLPYNGASLDLEEPAGIVFRSVSSGADAYCLYAGVVRSMTAIWSGFLSIGRPVYAAMNSLGYAVGSYAGHPIAQVGHAIGADAICVMPAFNRPRLVQEAATGGALRGANFDFALPVGRRGFARHLRVTANSCNAYRVLLHSAATRTNSELLYSTRTTSVDGGAADYDVNTLTYIDAAGFPFECTQAVSGHLIYGRIVVQSASSVGSEASFNITLAVDRIR